MAYNLKKIIERQARNTYQCQCEQPEPCSEIIHKGERYMLIKALEKEMGEYRNKELKISTDCKWWQKWGRFLR